MTTRVFFVQAGRRHTIHRGLAFEGVEQVGTERCNLDDAGQCVELMPGDLRQRLCGWCFPRGELPAESQAITERN